MSSESESELLTVGVGEGAVDGDGGEAASEDLRAAAARVPPAGEAGGTGLGVAGASAIESVGRSEISAWGVVVIVSRLVVYFYFCTGGPVSKFAKNHADKG
eukprot:SAG11_NODE_8657_length_989_cov_1.741863_1_plen_100_part_10